MAVRLAKHGKAVQIIGGMSPSDRMDSTQPLRRGRCDVHGR